MLTVQQAQEIAERLRFSKSGDRWRGNCPACGYANAGLLSRRGKLWCVSCQDVPALNDVLARLGAGGTLPRASSPGKTEKDSTARTAAALALWDHALPVIGTPAEAYLKGRGVGCLVSSSALRFLGQCTTPERGVRLPAMLALIVDQNGNPQAVHRTFLRHDGSGKANVDAPRASKGPTSGGVIRLHPPAEAIVIGEGIETSASASLLLGLPAWCAVACGNMPRIALPAIVRSVVIAADPDAPGHREAKQAMQRWRMEGRQVRIATPTGGGDFNDVLQSRHAARAVIHG